MVSREDILRKAHYGTQIYSHIIREKYPEDEVVMRIVGRDCGLCRNPYAGGENTLYIWHEKNTIKTRFLEALPITFSRSDYLEAAQKVGLKAKTAESYITSFLAPGGPIERLE